MGGGKGGQQQRKGASISVPGLARDRRGRKETEMNSLSSAREKEGRRRALPPSPSPPLSSPPPSHFAACSIAALTTFPPPPHPDDPACSMPPEAVGRQGIYFCTCLVLLVCFCFQLCILLTDLLTDATGPITSPAPSIEAEGRNRPVVCRLCSSGSFCHNCNVLSTGSHHGTDSHTSCRKRRAADRDNCQTWLISAVPRKTRHHFSRERENFFEASSSALPP